MDARFIVLQLMNSLSYGCALYMIASGFSLIFGLMKLTNMTHVVYFMIGSYVSYSVCVWSGSFVLGLLAASLVTSVIGLVVFKGFLFRLRGEGQSQVLLCLGFLFILDDALLAIFGGYPKSTPVPKLLSGSMKILGFSFPKYRLFMIGIGVLIAVILNVVINKTKYGALLRSGVDDAETVQAMGVNINVLFVIVYVGATLLAAIGGTLGGPFLSMEPKMSFTLLPIVLAIVIIGGMGNLNGAFYGSIIVATIDNFCKVLAPSMSYFSIFLPMAMILVFKPEGLFVKSGSEKLFKKRGTAKI